MSAHSASRKNQDKSSDRDIVEFSKAKKAREKQLAEERIAEIYARITQGDK